MKMGHLSRGRLGSFSQSTNEDNSMIYYIDASVFDLILAGEMKTQIEIMMNEMKKVVESDYHLVSTDDPKFSRKASSMIKKINEVSYPATFWMLKYIDKRYAEYYSFVKKIHPKIHVFPHSSVTKFVLRKHKKNELVPDVDLYISDSVKSIRLTEPVSLTSEDISDEELYESIAEAFLYKCYPEVKNLMTLKMEYGYGSGGRTGDRINRHIFHDKKFVLGIFDSDRKSPFELGEGTASAADPKKVLGNKMDVLAGAYCYYVLPVHEKENLLLPSEYLSLLKLQEQYDDGHTLSQKQKIMQKLCEAEDEKDDQSGKFYLDYYDLKKGVSTSDSFFAPLFKLYPDLVKQNTTSFNENSLHLRNPLLNANVKEVDWTNHSRLFELRKSIGKMVIAWGISDSKKYLS